MKQHSDLIDEVVVHQRLGEGGAPPDQDVRAGSLLELGDARGDVVADDRRVVPVGRLEGRGDDVLRKRVHPDREVAFDLLHRRPGSGEPLVGDPPEEESVARGELVALVLRQVVTEIRKRPVARLLDHAVERDVLTPHDVSHQPG
jgi:hypothetical protein